MNTLHFYDARGAWEGEAHTMRRFAATWVFTALSGEPIAVLVGGDVRDAAAHIAAEYGVGAGGYVVVPGWDVPVMGSGTLARLAKGVSDE